MSTTYNPLTGVYSEDAEPSQRTVTVDGAERTLTTSVLAPRPWDLVTDTVADHFRVGGPNLEVLRSLIAWLRAGNLDPDGLYAESPYLVEHRFDLEAAHAETFPPVQTDGGETVHSMAIENPEDDDQLFAALARHDVLAGVEHTPENIARIIPPHDLEAPGGSVLENPVSDKTIDEFMAELAEEGEGRPD